MIGIFSMSKKNLIAKIAGAAEYLPQALRAKVLSKTFGTVVPMVGTAGISYDLVTAEKVICSIKNRRKMQNHIHGVHAVAMALLAETATGFVVSMNIQPEGMVLIKSLKVEYKKVAKGDLIATATLSVAQRELMATTPKGELTVPCIITDETGQSPVECEMIWVWLPKKKKEK
jgi:acyl-coenzyme A thioesterase PaaI-like protein